MLCVSRKVNEKVIIGRDIVVTIVEIGQGKIRLGIEAPKDVPVYRTEIAPTELIVDLIRRGYSSGNPKQRGRK